MFTSKPSTKRAQNCTTCFVVAQAAELTLTDESQQVNNIVIYLGNFVEQYEIVVNRDNCLEAFRQYGPSEIYVTALTTG
jgi:hypothetical protein